MPDPTSSVEPKNQNTIVTIEQLIPKDLKDNRTIVTGCKIVDKLLAEYRDLIEPEYKSWFAKRFYVLGFAEIHTAAGKARNKARDPKHYFSKAISVMFNELKSTG